VAPLGTILGNFYGRAAAARRASFESHPERRRQLSKPVISIGNLVAGGSGKTPIVAYVAALLAREGERPAVLSRGYGRRQAERGVVVVSDGTRITADIDRAGDEPLMLARALAEAPHPGPLPAARGEGGGAGVFVAADRHSAGALAEEKYGATVHVLDDGFQHLQLKRDVDLVVVTPRDLEEEKLLPAGRLREPRETIKRADALLVPGVSLIDARALAAKWGVPKAFTVTRTPAVPRMVEPYGSAPRVPRSSPIVAVAGIARPERFLDDLTASGWTIADALIFRDHHRFDRGDVSRIARRVRETGASLVLTTEKDVMRLMSWRPLAFPLAWVPLAVGVEPADDFRLWLRWKLSHAVEGSPPLAEGRAPLSEGRH
jgi:tetraacyldisaccharide 4'-kinase